VDGKWNEEAAAASCRDKSAIPMQLIEFQEDLSSKEKFRHVPSKLLEQFSM
jgi:hypothetical protein